MMTPGTSTATEVEICRSPQTISTLPGSTAK
jgi:hypothetical protein